MPFANKHVPNPPFAARFAACLYEEGTAKTLNGDLVCVAFKELFFRVIPAFDVEERRVSAKRRKVAPASSEISGYYDSQR